MHKVSEIKVEQDLILANKELAKRNREELKGHGITTFNIMGAIGSGKTILIERALEKLEGYKVGVIVGDIVSAIDAKRVERFGVPVFGLNTGKECHLDAHLVEHALEGLPLEKIDILLIENVGNLICPTDFELGEDRRVVVVSVSEGDDIVEKHPAIFHEADLIIVNKIDIASSVDADAEKMAKDAARINPKAKVLTTSARLGDGVDDWIDYIKSAVKSG